MSPMIIKTLAAVGAFCAAGGVLLAAAGAASAAPSGPIPGHLCGTANQDGRMVIDSPTRRGAVGNITFTSPVAKPNSCVDFSITGGTLLNDDKAVLHLQLGTKGKFTDVATENLQDALRDRNFNTDVETLTLG